jgi:hypothetical protein
MQGSKNCSPRTFVMSLPKKNTGAPSSDLVDCLPEASDSQEFVKQFRVRRLNWSDAEEGRGPASGNSRRPQGLFPLAELHRGSINALKFDQREER